MVVEDDSLMDTINSAVENVCVRSNIEKSVDSKDSIEHLINYHDGSKVVEDDAKSEFESAMLYKKISAEEIEKARQVLLSNQEKLIVEDGIEEEIEISEDIQDTVYSEVQIHIDGSNYFVYEDYADYIEGL